MKTFIDPNFKYHRAVTQVLSELGRRMTDAEILPFDCNEYASVLIEQKNNLQRLEGKRLKANNVDTGNLNKREPCDISSKILNHIFFKSPKKILDYV